jgi:hypothetical protein
VPQSRPGADWQFRPRGPHSLRLTGMPAGQTPFKVSEVDAT